MGKNPKLSNPFKPLTSDPYTLPIKKYKEKGACAIIRDKSKPEYRLKTVSSPKNHEITHKGACGACSTLQDLEVYKKYKDLTKEVKSCALKGLISNKKQYECIKKLGFTTPCAWMWHYDAINTRKNCFWPCILNFYSPYNKKNGDLNSCLQCDEKKSGPTFLKFGGRNRRNSNPPITSAIKRNTFSFHNRKKSQRKKSPRKKSQRKKSFHVRNLPVRKSPRKKISS